MCVDVLSICTRLTTMHAVSQRRSPSRPARSRRCSRPWPRSPRRSPRCNRKSPRCNVRMRLLFASSAHCCAVASVAALQSTDSTQNANVASLQSTATSLQNQINGIGGVVWNGVSGYYMKVSVLYCLLVSSVELFAHCAMQWCACVVMISCPAISWRRGAG